MDISSTSSSVVRDSMGSVGTRFIGDLSIVVSKTLDLAGVRLADGALEWLNIDLRFLAVNNSVYYSCCYRGARRGRTGDSWAVSQTYYASAIIFYSHKCAVQSISAQPRPITNFWRHRRLNDLV